MASISNKRNRDILIIDDTRVVAEEYGSSIKLHCSQDLDVTVVTNVKDAVNSAQSNTAWDLILLDMIMPPGEHFNLKETSGGKYTGVYLAKHLREILPQVPIIILSDASLEDVERACQAAENRIANCIFLKKQAAQPLEMAKMIDRYFTEGILKKPSEGFLQRIFGAFLLQPNISGVGFDLKKLAAD